MTYEEIKAAAIAYADRYDLEVEVNLDTFIQLAEARMNRLLRVRKQSVRAITPTVKDSEYYSLPPDYNGMRDIQLVDPTGESEGGTYGLLSPEQMNARSTQEYAGLHYYSVIADQLQIFPSEDAGLNIEMTYYQKVPNLNGITNENWMSIDNPDVYLSGIIAEIEVFVKNYEVAAGWQGRMSSAIDEIDTADVKERWSGTPLTTKVG